MKTTCKFLDAVKARRGLASDYALAPVLGVTRSAVSRYRQGKDFFSDSAAIRCAELLEIDPAVVIACVHAERAKAAPEKALWESIAERLGGAAAALLLGFAAVSAPPPAAAAAPYNGAIFNTHYPPLRLATF